MLSLCIQIDIVYAITVSDIRSSTKLWWRLRAYCWVSSNLYITFVWS